MQNTLPISHPCPTSLQDGGGFTPQVTINYVRRELDRLAQITAERVTAVSAARPALSRLVEVMANGTGQSYKLRALLYSLWNGAPTSLLEIVAMDWELRKDLLAVMKAFGADGFFYDDVKAAICQAHLWAWFLQAGDAKE